VEFGAHDGKTNSNTYRLEKEFGWSGLLVEPIPDAYELLKKNRTCQTIHGCISNSSGKVFFLEVTGPACQLSGIFDGFPASHIKRIERAVRKEGGDKVMHEIRAITLRQLLEDHHIRKIDYLSIDTEGSEYEILKDFPFCRFEIGVIAVENQYHGDYLIDLMDQNGFELVDIVGGDEIYVNQKYNP
jgi:FkbM family methyltransferase